MRKRITDYIVLNLNHESSVLLDPGKTPSRAMEVAGHACASSTVPTCLDAVLHKRIDGMNDTVES